MASNSNPEKKVDLPPKGRRNADPLTSAPGSHPIETGVGAALVGAAAGAGAGAVAGPVGTVLGAAIGGVVGGYAGKSVGEAIDPTTEDRWLHDNFTSRPYVEPGAAFQKYEPAYRFGGEAECRHHGDCFDEIEGELEQDWNSRGDECAMPWQHARDAVKDGYDRTVQIRRARDMPAVTDESLDELED
jgi:hypothetical protein